jgi:hypothetical protein
MSQLLRLVARRPLSPEGVRDVATRHIFGFFEKKILKKSKFDCYQFLQYLFLPKAGLGVGCRVGNAL